MMLKGREEGGLIIENELVLVMVRRGLVVSDAKLLMMTCVLFWTTTDPVPVYVKVIVEGCSTYILEALLSGILQRGRAIERLFE
jgi:hypothetical protein